MEDKLLGLYNDFKTAGLFTNTKDYNTFRKRMQGQGYQSQIYKVAKQNGADVGQFWQFQRNFGLGRWSGNANQPAKTSKPLTTSQMAKQIGDQYKQTIQQRSAAYNTGANFAKSQKENQENPIGELASEAWEGIKGIGRSVGNYLGNIGQGMQTTTGGAAPARPYAQPSKYHPKPSKETQQIVKKWGTLTKKDSELSPSERIQANNIRSRIQNAQQQEYNQQKRNANPISESRITPNAKNENEVALNLSTDAARQARIKQQHEDDLNQMAYQGVGQNLGKDIFDMTDKAISMAEQASKDFFKGAEDATSFWNQYNPILQKKIADEADRRKSTEFIQQGLQIGLANKVQDYFSRPEIQKYVVDMADKMNISVEDAVQKYFMPNLMRYGQDAVSQRQLENVLPQGFWDYLGKNLSNSIAGMIASNAVYSKEERQRRQQALAISEGMEEMPQMAGHKSDYYKAGLGSRAVGSLVNMAVDSPFFGVGGTAADFAVNTGTRLLTRGLERVGLVKLGAKLTPKEVAFKAANMSTEQKIMSGLFTNTAKSSLNLGGYSGLTGALQQISTGDDSSAAAVAAAAIEGGWHGMKTGAMFGLSGSITHPLASRYGITGLETSQRQRMLHGAQKLGAHAASLGVEAGTMMVADHLQDGKEMSLAQWLEDGVMVMSFKLGEPKVYKHIGSTLHGLVHNTNNTPITLTKDERNELVNSVSGKNLMDAFVSVNAKEKSIRDKNGNLTLDKHIAESLYKDFMADPEVSRSTKEKVNAALGMPSQNYKISQRSVNDVKNKQVLEYANDGTLLTRTSYKNAEERRDILYRQKVGRENMNIFNLVGIAKMRGVQMTDENGNVKDITIDFLKSHGYDITKDATDPKNAKLVADIKNVNNPLYTEWVMFSNKHADELYGLTDEIKGILKKDPLKRTDEEIKVMKDYSTKLESMLYPENEPHGEQSFVQGRNVVQDNNLGTEQPNGEAVKAELNGLKQAEDEMDVLIRDNDVFEQNFQKLKQQGLTNPQIYDWMVQQGGLTVEQLEPFAHYINANARVQGMQEATKNAIDEQVSSYVQDWSFHGTLNGQEMNGEQAIFVQDRDGRMLILGSGEIAFDSTTGRAKEGVGDMIVCLDTATNEMVYLKSDDVTLSQTQDAENFGNEYRQKLQMINSEPYNQAAQEQAMKDAAKPQQEVQPKENKNEEISNKETDGKIQKGDNANIGSDGKREGNIREGDASVQQVEQPQPTRKFADGSDVPMTTDSKGRPTPDYEKMTPEQSAEILAEDFGENAEKVVDGQIQKAEKALKDAEKMKVDYTAEPNDIMEQEALKNRTIEAAKKQLDHAQNIKKTMTAQKVAETMERPVEPERAADGVAQEAGVVSPKVKERFEASKKIKGRRGSITLADGTKIRGTYYYGETSGLTTSHDPFNDFKQSDGFPVNEDGTSSNSRSYRDKESRLFTQKIGNDFNGLALKNVPVVQEGITLSGNGTVMGKKLAEQAGKDSKYYEDLEDNAEGFGWTPEQIKGAGFKGIVYFVPDEKLPLNSKTFDLFNKKETKSESNTEQAVKNAKTLTSGEVGAIVAEIEGNGSLDAFFNNSKAINDLIKTLVDKGIIGQNEVAQMMDSPERLSAQGREYVKNLLLGSIFKPETIRMLGIDSTVKNKAINAIRSVMDNMKLGDYSLRDEIDQAIQLLYEARQGGNKVDTLLRTPDMFGEDAAKRYSSISQMMALALEGKVSDFRDLLDEYNRIAAARNTGEGDVFGEAPTKEELVKEFLNFKKWQDYGTGHSEIEGGNDVSGNEEPQQEASGGNEPAKAGTEPERPRVEEPDDLVNKELESRIKVTDEETETPSENGPITRQKILIDGDKEVIKVDEPNDKGEYTGSYYEYDGKKFGDLNEVVEYIDGKVKEKPLPLLPKEEKPDPKFNPIEAAAAEFKKEHPLTEDEIMNSDLDDLSKDIALDYLNGEVTDDLHRAIYESIYTKIHDNKVGIEPSEEPASPTSLKDRKEALLKRADSGDVKRKDEAWGMLADAEELVAEYYGIPYDEYGGRERTKSTTVSIVLGYVRRQLDKITDEPVPVASEKQVKFVNTLVKGERLWKAGLEGMLPNKRQAGWLIDAMKALGDEYLLKMHPDEIEARDNEIRKGIDLVRKFNGAKPFDWEKEAAKIYSTDPMDGIKSAANGYEKEKVSKTEPVKSEVKTADDAAVSASNKKVNDLWKELMNAGKDEVSSSFIGLNSRQLEVLPKLVSAMAENAYLRIKRGMHNLEDVVKEMRKEFAPAAKIFKKEDVDAIYEQMMNIRYRDGEQRMSLKEWADYYEKTSPKHQENLVGDSKTAEERKQAEKKFIGAVKLQLAFGRKFKSIVELRKIAERVGLKDIKDTDLQELAETAIVQRARSIAASEATDNAGKFKRILNLYENQPSLNQRDSERVMKQQYSTPAPYAFLADMYVKGNGKEIESALEPSAGNGMLTIGLPMDKVHVNDIDAQRLANLRRQGFKDVTSQDGTQPFADKDVDVVVTNPPFGSATPKEYDGYKISSLEGQMAINALESMKDDGRAAIIIGGKTEYAKNGSLNPKDKAFLGYLYSHYNVEDVINVDGGLYAKQGTSYPTRIILINGRRNYDPEHKVFPPVEKDARAETVKDYDELYKRIEDDILRERGVQKEPLGLSNRERSSDVSRDSLRQKERSGNGVTNNKEYGSEPDGGISDLGTRGSNERPMGETERTSSEHMGDNSELESGRDSDFGADRGTGSASSRLDNGGRVPEGSVARNANETSNERGAGGDRKQQGEHGRSSSSVQRTVPSREGNGLGVKREESPKRELSTEKVKYVPQSNNPFSLNSVIPADQARATKKALEKIGDVDSFLVDELGYNDADDMHHALASEQADSVALAIHQAKQGNAFIIGDMTGIGKGRQAAAMIRFAHKQGKIPVFITAKKALFSDIYRDLKSIGNSDLRPFIWAAKDKENSADMTDSEGKLVYQRTSDKEQERVMDYLQKNGKLPDGYDYIVTTYDSFSSGTMDYEDGKKAARKDGKGSKNGQRKRDILETIAKNTSVIMDESHRAGGQGGGSAYLQYVVPKLNAITFLSATYAKRPDNMPIYALRTSMNQAGMKPSELIDAIKRGGATLQEVMSQALTASGQFIRRERDMTGVTIDWKTIDDPVVVEEQREQYDSIIGLFNDIIHFQRTYVGAYLDKRNDELAAIQASIQNRQGTKDLGIHNQPFASRTYNMVQQVLLSLKAKEAAKSAIEHLKNGEKVVIALNNTNESQTEQYEANAEMEAPDLGVVLMKGLQGVLRYDITDDMGNKTFGTFNLEDLGPDAVARYHEIEDNIKNASTGLSLSPIDVVRDELEAAGYRVGELTGRQTMFVKNPNGTVSKVKRTDTDKKKLALDFNTNKLDALILNRSASTGISLHDSVEYDVEHKPRTMIVVQQQPDVNEEVQMRGRIDRTGQVNRGRYEYIVSQIPSEQRLLMMFKAKLKSLDANTTSSQKSKFNDMEVSDIINKYGDKVVREYMAEHLDLYSKMADPFGWESSYGEDLSTIDPQRLIVASGGKLGGKEAGADASKLLGRMALLRVNEQEKMLQEIGELYANEIQRLNEMGENDLEITELPLKAKTIRKEVWKQGSEPGGDNAFADNTYIEKVNMAILKKPMKAAEVKASQEGLTGGKTWEEYKTEKKAAVKEYFDQKIADETQKYEERAVKAATKAKEKYIKDAKKGQKDSGMSDEKIEKMAGYQYDNIYKQEKDKLNDVVKNLKAKAEMFERVLDTFDTNQTFVLPTDMNNPNELSGFGNSYGRLIDIKITDNYSPNASSVSFATLDGRRKITFPIAGKVGSGENKVDIIGSIDRMTKQAASMGDNHIKVLNQDLNNWDRLTSNESRKDGYIVTGNLMQALVDSKDQGLGGQLVKYTTDTGEVKTGILMPDRFDPKGLTTDAPINSVAEKFELSSWHGGIDEVTSSDGEVKVKRIDNYRGNFYELRVPKSKAKGGKYFMDNDLLKLVNDNNFETRGNSMLAEFKPEQLKPVLDRLSKMGVKVQEERKASEDEGTHFREDRGLQYSKTDAKDVKNSRIIPEDVDKNVSSQIEKKFDDRVDELTKDLSDGDKAEFNRHLDFYTSEFSRYKASEITYTLNGLENEVRFWERTFGNREKASRTHLVQLKRAELEAAETAARREMDYREVRAKALADGYGLRRGAKASFADISRLFEATNQAKEEGTRRLFEKACDIAKRLGVEFGGKDEGDERGNVGEATPERNINLFIDTLSRTYTNPKEAAHTILHELIHQATMGAIHLVKDGKAEGMLTPKQIEAVKTVIDIYNKAKADRRIVWEKGNRRDYGAKDEYEFAAEMAGEKQRKILSIPFGERIMNAAKELRYRGDNSLWQAVKNAWHKLFEVSDKSKMDKALNDIMDDFNEKIDDIAMNDIEENGYAYRVTDKDELDRLNKEKTFRMYSGMQEVDGKLYSPMAAIIDGKRTDATEIGAWMGADERPDLVKNGKFQLVKTDKNPGAGEGPVPAAYNPYMHTSTSVMNDQFSGAYARGNIKVVEWEIPESEKTSGYHAEGAKNSVGLVPWTSGTVNSLLPKDRQRSVMLSRWRKAVRILPDEEVAEKIADQLRGTGLAIPWNVVTPNQLRELVKLGVPITTVEQGRQNPETKEKFLQQMADLEQEFPQAKFVNVKMTKDAFKVWGKNGGTKFRTDNGESSYPTSSVESHVEKVAQKTGGKVKMVSSVDEITNKAAKAAIEEGRKITGWYDEKTGEVHLYMPNIHDRYTAEKTIWHEVVGHKGMRELFGEDRFEKFLRDVWYDLDKPENAALKKLVDEERKFNPMNIYDAIEEGIARLAEDGKGEAGFWNGIKNKVSDFLHEIGYRIAPNTKDVKYLLWLSKNLQKNPNDPYWKLRAEAVKYRLDHERTPAVVAHDGMFYGNDGKVRSMESLNKSEWDEATDGQIHFHTTPTAATALDRYHRSLDAHGYMATESYMDNMLSLKKLMNAIVPDKKIEDIASSENPYILQNVMQGAMSDAAKLFEINIMKPLEKSMAGILDAFDGKNSDEKIRNFNLYMITKHGLERNREFFVRDFLKQMRMDEQKKQDADFLENSYYSDKEYLDNELKAGNIDLKEYYRQLDKSIRNHFDADFEAGEHDYSGMHAIQEVAKSSDPYDDAEAIQSVMDSEAKMESIKKGAVKDYWDKVKAATQYSVDSDYKNGIISKELHGHVSNMFNWYVPLRKYDEATAEDTYGYITEKGDPKSYIGSTIMRARGHKYLSETNILAQIGAMGNRAISNGGQNAIRQAFARFARNNSGNNLITETSVWYEKDPVVNIVYERYPDIPEGATADEINQIVSDFNKDMKMKESQGMAYKVYRRDKIGYKFQRAENKSQHIVDVMIAGKKHSFVINGNPRAAQALNGMLEHKVGTFGKPFSVISRYMAQTCTSYNPEFVMRNMIRDFEFASTNLLAKEGMAYTKTFEKYYAQVGLIEGIRNTKLSDLKKMTGFGLFSKYRNGTLDTSDKIQRYFKEFMENGGETGWVQVKNTKELTEEYKLHIKTERNKVRKVSKGIFDAIFKNLENVNEVAENLARFATYCASRDAGRSAVRSAYDAKEVSTNFNRHGSGSEIKSFKNGEMSGFDNARKQAYRFTSAWFRNTSMFFNAGIQSTNLLIKNFKNNKAGTIGYIMAGPMISGMAMALLNNFLIANEDEKDRKGVKDPYGELPDYIRRNNLCIYVGGGDFVTIPLAIEERAFYGLGDLAAGLTFSKNISGQKNPALDAVGCISQLAPVTDYLGNASFGKNPGEETLKAVLPSATSPFLEWAFNSDWKGAPIHRENKFDEYQPSWMLAYQGTPEWLINMNKKVNAMTNDVAPGNENMLGNGFLDAVTDPSGLQHFYSGYLGGAATFMERLGGIFKNGKDTETKDIPFVRSLFYTPSEKTSLQRTKSKWYNYLDETEKMIANAKRLKSKNVPLDELVKNYGDYYKFKQSKGAEKMNVIETATKEMKKWKKLRDKSSDTESIKFANQNIDNIMMKAVDELDKLN